MFAHDLAVGRLDRPRVRRKIAVQKFAEGALADEADSGRVLFLGVGKSDAFGERAHLGLEKAAHGKEYARDLLL